MGVVKKQPIEKWIDLSALPRRGKLIDWVNSVGHVLPFQYDYVKSNIHIVDYIKSSDGHHKLLITIDNYTPSPVVILPEYVLHCMVESLVYNKIADKAQHIIQYLTNKDDAYIYTYSSNKKISTTCPICGNVEMKNICNLYTHGFFCEACSDKVSMPNKLMFHVLKQCDISFIPEVSLAKGFDWITNGYRYDFYFQSFHGDNILVEMDGRYHYDDIDCVNRDIAKNILAQENNFKLIRINCDYCGGDSFEYVKDKILNSELKEILPLNKVNWEYCKHKIMTSLMVTVCNLWEKEKLSIIEISKKTLISHSTIVLYLKRGMTIGLCPSYNTIEASRRRDIYNQKPILIIDNNNVRHVVSCTNDAIELFKTLFNVSASKTGINQACRTRQTYKGFNIYRISNEQYKMIKNNNEANLKGVV